MLRDRFVKAGNQLVYLQETTLRNKQLELLEYTMNLGWKCLE